MHRGGPVALTDDEVHKQIKHMIAFIDQEAREKSDEIDARAEEEFNIEKAHVLQQQRLKIMAFYDKKEKQVELQRKIQSSNMINQARLKVLKERETHIRKLIDDTREELAKVPEDKDTYSELLHKLIVQCLFQLIEPNVTIKVKECDVGLVNSLLGQAQEEYKSVMQKNVNLTLDQEDYLPPNTCGGIEVSASRNRIKVCNTLESRMNLIANRLMPAIRVAIFGRNPNRRFDD